MSNREKCHHTKISPFSSAISHYTFCLHCGAIIIKENTTNSLKYFLKPLNQEKLSSTNPIEIALLMKEKLLFSLIKIIQYQIGIAKTEKKS